eukprot:787439-Alexandrium_andersonii.AAC.1
MATLRERVSKLGAAPSDSKRQLALLYSMDLAQRRISLIGFADAVSATDRVTAIDEIIKKVPGTSNFLINHFYTGPYKASYIQFVDVPDRNHFLLGFVV